MADPRLERLADVLVDYSAAVKPGDIVMLESATPIAAPLVRALFRRVLRAGGHPHLRIGLDGGMEALLTHATDEQLDWLNPVRLEEVERADVRMSIEAETNTRSLTHVDPARQRRLALARDPIRDRHFARSAAGELRSVVTLYPTQATAQDAEMSLEQYEDFVFRAGLLDRDEPVAAWQSLGERIARLAEWLGEKEELRVVSGETDLSLGIGGRTWIPCRGKENFPDGEVFTGPVETRVEGTIRFTYPATFAGRRIRDIELRFRGGEVVEAHASEGEDFLQEMLAMDDGARRAGEFSFGLNESVTEFTGHTLFDEKIGGTCHLALGRSYPESGGVNRSALHWDLVSDLRAESEVYADGELVYRDGRFLDGNP
jgi:aminopeptidase